MEARKLVLRQTGMVALGVALGAFVMVWVFDLLGYYDSTVAWGAIAGSLLAVGNFFFMALDVCRAADKATHDDVNGGKAVMKTSFLGRMLVIFVLLVVLAKAGVCDPLASVIPLLFVRPTITLMEFFAKPEEK